jgi:hypothetical protein
MQYGELEDLLVSVVGGHREKVISRFRKLRPKFAADMLLSRPGTRVTYDLSRILSICAVYLVNSITIPQGQAVDVVIANFPEIARGSLRAWEGIQSGDGGNRIQAVVHICVDAFDSAWEREPSGATWATLGPLTLDGGAKIALDCFHIVSHLVEHQEKHDGCERLTDGFTELARSYGWSDGLEGEAEVIPTRRGSTFFSTGPYFGRARAILAQSPQQKLSSQRRAMLQSHLNYVERPPPIDAWKKHLGTEERSPRLCHLVAVWGAELSLQSSIAGPEVLKAASYPSNIRALALIEFGERKLAELIEVPAR